MRKAIDRDHATLIEDCQALRAALRETYEIATTLRNSATDAVARAQELAARLKRQRARPSNVLGLVH